MKLVSAAIGPYGTNCYLLTDEESGESAAVDCALFDDEYKAFIESSGITKLKYILLTHGHFDHITGVAPLKDSFGGLVCIHENDAGCLENPDESLHSYCEYEPLIPCKADVILNDGSSLFLGKNEIKVLHTPGHTQGSVCFFSDGIMFSGDTLFRLSMGRTDLRGGSTKELFASLREIGKIEGEYDVFPGHGEKTTLTFEKHNNRYLRHHDS